MIAKLILCMAIAQSKSSNAIMLLIWKWEIYDISDQRSYAKFWENLVRMFA